MHFNLIIIGSELLGSSKQSHILLPLLFFFPTAEMRWFLETSRKPKFISRRLWISDICHNWDISCHADWWMPWTFTHTHLSVIGRLSPPVCQALSEEICDALIDILLLLRHCSTEWCLLQRTAWPTNDYSLFSWDLALIMSLSPKKNKVLFCWDIKKIVLEWASVLLSLSSARNSLRLWKLKFVTQRV